jgi:dethiobiotin synthetase
VGAGHPTANGAGRHEPPAGHVVGGPPRRGRYPAAASACPPVAPDTIAPADPDGVARRTLTGMRPRRLVAVVGTGTDVGKTWVSARLLTDLRAAGLRVAARKPAQSFAPDDDPVARDAAVLGAASGEAAFDVCPADRWYEIPMAPPMAADSLGRPPFTIEDLVSELRWPPDAVDVGLVETAGSVRSPLAADGDCLALCVALVPDVVVLVADAGLGTINAARLTVDALRSIAVAPSAAVMVVLNRFDAAVDLHVRNREWLQARDALSVVGVPGGDRELAAFVAGTPAGG